MLKLEFEPLLIGIATEGTRCPNELSSVCIKYLKAEILQAKKPSHMPCTKAHIKYLHFSLWRRKKGNTIGAREGGATCDWYRSPDWGWGCNHFVAYSFNGNDNCWLCQETEEELQALQVKQVNRRTWRRSTEAIKSSFVTRMRCSKMPTHAKDKVLHETKNKSKAKIILMVKKCSGSC